MLAEFKAVSSRVLKAGIIALAKAGDKFQDKLAVSVMHLAVSTAKEVYHDDSDNVLSAKALIAREVPEGIANASRGTVERYVEGLIDFIQSTHGFTQDELSKDIPARAFSICRALVSDVKPSDNTLTKRQILGHLRNKSIQSKDIQTALGRVDTTKAEETTPTVSSTPVVVSAEVQLENAVSAHRSISETDEGIQNQDAVVSQVKALFQMLDKAHKLEVVNHFVDLKSTLIAKRPKASAKATPRKRKTATRKTGTRK
tara:strand:- start:17 stop:787 length:771 start_codon:yes stop_codon:yes gene_type:complete